MIIITLVLSLLGFVASLFYVSNWLTVLLTAVFFVQFSLLVFYTLKQKKLRKKEAEKTEQSAMKYDQHRVHNEKAIRDMESKLERMEQEKSELLEMVKSAAETALVPMSLQDMVEQLGKFVINTTNQSVLEITEDIYSIVDNSNELNNLFKTISVGLCEGDESLESDIGALESFIDKLDTLQRSFTDMVVKYKTDMGVIEKAVTSINDYTSVISDLSEKINILAINASIEAARVGKQGEGFSVIAGEVQNLSKQTKDFADNINDMMHRTGQLVESSYKSQNESLDEAKTQLSALTQGLHLMIQHIQPQVREVKAVVHESEDKGKELNRRLNEITKSLQFQDMIRQVLEHIHQIQNELNIKIMSAYTTLDLNLEAEEQRVEKLKLMLAEKYFTVKDEWLAVGLEPNETKVDKKAKELDLQGNISLF